MPHTYATHAVLASEPWLWLFGGVADNPGVVDAGVGAARASLHGHQVPQWGDHVYRIGGGNRRIVWKEVVIGVVGER